MSENQSPVAAKLDRFTGYWIPPASGPAIHYFQRAEADYVNVVAFLQAGFYYFKEFINQSQRVPICETPVVLRDHPCDIGLGHFPCPLLDLSASPDPHLASRWTRADLCYAEARKGVNILQRPTLQLFTREM